MALQVWLPLTKDLRQQGLSNVTVTNNGATYSSTGGKLGGCYSFGTLTSYLTLNPESLKDFNKVSLACWIKINTWNTNYATIIHAKNGTGYSWANIIFGLSRYGGNNALCFTIANGSSSTSGSVRTGTLNTEQWYHICCTYEPGIVKMYQDGELVHSATTSIVPAFDTIANCFIGTANGSAYQLNAWLNDFRIYDHCLSPMEVKQISQGLVLHYPLNRQGWGQENLAINTGTRAPDRTSQVEWVGFNIGILPITTNEVLTISFDIKMEIGTAINGYPYLLVYNSNYRGPHGGWLYKSNSSSNLMIPSGNYAVGDIIERRCSITITTPSSFNAGTSTEDWIEFYSNYSTENKITITNLKIERGSIATPWCPNSSDELATTMGLNSTTEYDCSGFCNNGTRTGTFTWTSNTPKYAVSQIFNGTDNAIQTPNLTTMITDKNYTIACWTYKTVIGTKNYQTIYGGPSGFELEARNSSSTSPLYRIYNWGGGTTAYNFGEWTHFCFVHTDSDSKLYVNGELKITGTSINIPSGNYFVGAWKNSTSQNYEGNMSDFRIYATALSADDVKFLYNSNKL